MRLLLASIAISVTVSGCVAPAVRYGAISIYDANAGKKIAPKNVRDLTSSLETKKGSMETQTAYEARRNSLLSKYENTRVLLNAMVGETSHWKLLNRDKDADGMATFNIFQFSRGDCVTFDENLVGSKFSMNYELCSPGKSFSRKSILISPADAKKIGDVENIRIALQGTLTSPFMTNRKSESGGFYFEYFQLYVKDPQVILFDKRTMEVIGVLPF